MKATSIKITKKGAEIKYLEEASGGTKEIRYFSKEAPLPDLPAALAAFRDYVIDLCELPKDWKDTLVITTLSIRAPNDEGLRGLIVHFHRGMEKAGGRVMLSATPFMPEASGEESENVPVLDDATIELIEAAEAAAARYVDGQHGEQIDAFDGDEDEEIVESEGPEGPVDVPISRGRKRSQQMEHVGA